MTTKKATKKLAAPTTNEPGDYRDETFADLYNRATRAEARLAEMERTIEAAREELFSSSALSDLCDSAAQAVHDGVQRALFSLGVWHQVPDPDKTRLLALIAESSGDALQELARECAARQHPSSFGKVRALSAKDNGRTTIQVEVDSSQAGLRRMVDHLGKVAIVSLVGPLQFYAPELRLGIMTDTQMRIDEEATT